MKPRRTSPPSHQHGLSLIEMMVAMAVALALLAGVLQVYGSTKQNYRLQEALSRLQENGRYAVYVLERQLRMADYAPAPSSGTLPAPQAAGLGGSEGGPASDSVAVRYVAAVDACTGAALGPTLTTFTFSIKPNGLGNPALYCNNGSVERELVEHVEFLNILYGEDRNNNPPVRPDRYASLSAVDPRRVVSVRIAVLLRTPQPVFTKDQNESYTLLDTTVGRNDRYLRKIMQTTVDIRNRLNARGTLP